MRSARAGKFSCPIYSCQAASAKARIGRVNGPVLVCGDAGSFVARQRPASCQSPKLAQRLQVEFEKNTLLFGSDPTEGIVAVELGDTGTVRVHRRGKTGATTVEVEPFHPFVWADGDVADLGLENAEKLEGDLKYNWLITVDSWKELIDLRNGLKAAGRSFFALSDPVQHYLTATGRTLFKGLALEKLKRLQLEVIAPSGENDLAEAAESHSPASPSRITPDGKS